MLSWLKEAISYLRSALSNNGMRLKNLLILINEKDCMYGQIHVSHKNEWTDLDEIWHSDGLFWNNT